MSLGMALMAGTQIMGAYGSYKSAGTIASTERKMAELQKEYNQKEIEEKYKRDFMGMAETYTEKRALMIKEAAGVASTLNTVTANAANVDNEFNSFRSDSLSKLDSDFISNLNEITSEQIFNMRELSETRINSELNNDLQLNNMMTNISSKQLQSESNAVNKALMGAYNSASQLMKYSQDKRTDSEAKTSGAEQGALSSFGESFKNMFSGLGGFLG